MPPLDSARGDRAALGVTRRLIPLGGDTEGGGGLLEVRFGDIREFVGAEAVLD
jgi:hypothetical protein